MEKRRVYLLEVAPAYKTIVTHPAEYKTVTETVLVKEAYKRLEIVPAYGKLKQFLMLQKKTLTD